MKGFGKNKLSIKTMDQQEIAEAFSNGKFDLTYPYLDDNVEWKIVGDKTINGKNEVIRHCEITAEYFESVMTDFTTINVIVAKNRVAIDGAATFMRNEKIISLVSACDVYEFTKNGLLKKITSYCIPIALE
jgi:hypothetical protein